jgi:glycosyltransferase involved in cell wall biosynthesis
MKFSLIIPCYNEAASLPLLLERCSTLPQDGTVEVLLVDNGSTDRSQQVLTELLPLYPYCRSIRVKVNQGYGHGILSGLTEARGEIIGWTHADLQTDPTDLLQAIPLFSQGAQFVKGRRYGRPLSDTFFTVGMSLFETVLLGQPLWDINAQPTLFTRSFFESWQHPPHDFSLDLYAYFQARRQDLRIARIPVFLAGACMVFRNGM